MAEAVKIIGHLGAGTAGVPACPRCALPWSVRNCSLSKVVEVTHWLRSTRAGEDACGPRTEVSDYFYNFDSGLIW